MSAREALDVLRQRVLPEASDYAGLGRSWRSDVLAGVTVGVVALPLALAFGVTSGVGAAAGLVTAIVAGLVAAVFGGSNLQVSGPTGAMAVVLVPIVSRFGAEAVIPVAIMAGGMVMAMGLLGLGRAVTFIPWPVVEGFTIGIATIIFLQQVPLALNMPKPEGENTALVAVRAIATADWAAALPSLALVALVAILMVGLPRIRRSLPASIIAIVLATLAATWLRARRDDDRAAAGRAADATPAGPRHGDDQRPVLGRAGGRRAGRDREPAVRAGRRRHDRHVAPEPRPGAVRPGAGQRGQRDVRRHAGHRCDRPHRGERARRRSHPGVRDRPLAADPARRRVRAGRWSR